MPRKGFVSVAIPRELYIEAGKYVKANEELGYTGVPELLRELLRQALQTLNQRNKEVASS